jgi:hypothetical protein
MRIGHYFENICVLVQFHPPIINWWFGIGSYWRLLVVMGVVWGDILKCDGVYSTHTAVVADVMIRVNTQLK